MTSRAIWIAFELLVVAMPVAAQPVGEWYVVGTAGKGLGVIGGGEAVVKDVVGVGLEAGALLGGLGFTFSPGASFRIPSVGPVTPFVSAGATFYQWFYGSFRGFHVGGGLDYRLSPTRGVRFEVRSHHGTGFYSSDRFLSMRIGMTFR